MASGGGTYLPPVIASLVGEVGDLAKTLVEGKAMLDEFSKTPTTVNVTAEITSLAQLQADLFKDIGDLKLLAEEFPIDVPMQLDMFSILSDTSAVRLFAEQPIKVPIVPVVDMTALATDRAVIGATIGTSVGPSFWKSLLATSAAAGFGGGIAIPFTGINLARFGSLAGLAGFGFERVLTLAIGLIASMSQALMGLGVIAAGTFATMAVGMGSDMIVMSSTIADTRTLTGLWTTLQQAVLIYGADSTQAQTATQNLNNELKILGNTAGVQAELGLAKLAYTINQQWDQASSNARVQAVNLLTQILYLGQSYIPLVTAAASRNLSLINTALVPLFTWLKGPQGMGIFNDLENKFARDLPTAMEAFDQGIEFLFRFLDLASNYTGGFVQSLDRLFTYLNSPVGFQRVAKDVADVIKVFDVWKGFIIILLKDVALLFGQSVGVGTTMISMLTGVLTKLHDYLSSTSGKNSLNSLFNAHKNEIIAILNLLPQLAPALSIYIALAVPLTTIAADVISLLNFMLSIPTVGPAIAWGLALIIIVNQMKLMALFTGLAGLITGIGNAIKFAGFSSQVAALPFEEVTAQMGYMKLAALGIAAPVGIVGALLVAVGVLVYLVATHWQYLGTLMAGFGGIFITLGQKIFAAAVVGLTGWTQTFSLLGTLFHNAFAQWGAAFSEFGTAVHLVFNKIGSEISNSLAGWGATFSLLGTAINLVGGKISTAFNNMIANVKATLSNWETIGESIITGVINGIGNKLTWAKNQIGSFFNSLLHSAKLAIGWGSPSTVYSDLAASIPQGVAQGITKNTATTLTALASMFSQMQSHGRMLAGGGGFGSPSLAMAGGGGRGPVSINMPITVQVSGASAATPQGIGTAVQQGVQKEIDRLIQMLQGGIYSNPGT